MGHVFNRPYSASSSSNCCIGRIDENGYIFNDPFTTRISSDRCIGRVDNNGYIFNDPYTTNTTSSRCVGRVDRNGYIFSDPYTTQTTSSRCIGRVSTDGYVFNDPYTYNTTSSHCIGKVDDYNIYHCGAAAYLLLLRQPVYAETQPERKNTIHAQNQTPIPSAKPSAGGIIGVILGGIVLVAIGMFISWLGIDFFPYISYIMFFTSLLTLIDSFISSRYIDITIKGIIGTALGSFGVFSASIIFEAFVFGVVFRDRADDVVTVSCAMFALSFILIIMATNSEEYADRDSYIGLWFILVTAAVTFLKIKNFNFANEAVFSFTEPIYEGYAYILSLIFDLIGKIF